MIWIAVVFLILAVYPFLFYPLSLFGIALLVRPRVVNNETLPLPSISICFCGYNEESVIEEKISNLESVAQAYESAVEILFYADGCSDSTVARARNRALETQVFVGESRLGKSVGMNYLVGRAKHDLVVFTDANVIVEQQTLKELASSFSDPNVGVACGHLRFVNSDTNSTAAVGSLYWRLEEFIKKLETRTGSTMGADGSLFAIRRKLFREIPEDIIDDMYTSLSILCDGFRVIRVESAVALEKATTATGDEFQRKTRIACRCFNCFRLLMPRLFSLSPLNIYKFLGHKLLRWFSIFWLFLAWMFLGVSAISSSWANAYVVASIGGLLVVTCLQRVPILGRISEVLFSLFAVGVGVVQSVLGRRYQTWKPPTSTR